MHKTVQICVMSVRRFYGMVSIDSKKEDSTMRKMICAPGSYVQGPGELKTLADHVKALRRNKAYLIVDAFVDGIYHQDIVSSFEKQAIAYDLEVFGGECCMEEIEKHRTQRKDCDVIFGIGGGKTLDTAKAVSFYEKCPVVIVPTAASSDAPCSRLSVVYKSNGEFSHYLPLPQNPDMVIMDSEVITKAPVRFLSAGIGDALATYFEALACEKSHAVTMAGGVSTKAAMALAKLCNDTLLSKGAEAVSAVKEKEVLRIARFCKQVGLPITLEDLGLETVTDERLLLAAKETCKPEDTMVNMPFEVKPEDIVAAMREVDRLGKELNAQ